MAITLTLTGSVATGGLDGAEAQPAIRAAAAKVTRVRAWRMGVYGGKVGSVTGGGGRAAGTAEHGFDVVQ